MNGVFRIFFCGDRAGNFHIVPPAVCRKIKLTPAAAHRFPDTQDTKRQSQRIFAFQTPYFHSGDQRFPQKLRNRFFIKHIETAANDVPFGSAGIIQQKCRRLSTENRLALKIFRQFGKRFFIIKNKFFRTA